MDRRQLVQSLLVAGLLSSVGTTASGAARQKPTALIKPKKLSSGDTIGMVLPATMAFEQHKIDMAKAQIEALGFQVKLGANARQRLGYFAGSDEQRAADLNAMFADQEVAGIFCFSGGWGSPRILPHLNYDLIRSNPKVLLGYSDITALLNVVHQQTGLVTFHGPMMASRLRPWSWENLQKTVMQTKAIGALHSPAKLETDFINRDYWLQTIRPGRASGKIVGGNLSLLAATMGTPWQLHSKNALVFLEEIDENPYRVDRMLTQLAQGGIFDQAAGVVFGYCTDCKVDGPSFSLEDVLQDRFAKLSIPVFSGFAFGHLPEMHTLPVGVVATMDADTGTILIDEAAVVD